MTVATAVGRVGVDETEIDLRREWPGAPERLSRMDRVCHLALLATFRALGVPPGHERSTAVVFGSALASLTTNIRFYDKVLKRGMRLADPKRFPYTSPNAAAGEIAIAFGLTGPNLALTSGLHAGLDAIATACRLVDAGRAERALAVVADATSEEQRRWLASADLEGLGPWEGAAAILIEPDGAPGVLGRVRPACLDRETQRLVAIAPVGALAIAEALVGGLASERVIGTICPVSGGQAAVAIQPPGSSQ